MNADRAPKFRDPLVLLRWCLHSAVLLAAMFGILQTRAEPRVRLADPHPQASRELQAHPFPSAEPPAAVSAESAPTAEPTQQPSDEIERPGIKEYLVQEGDTLRTIAEKFGVSTETLLWSNNMARPDLLRVGQRLQVPPVTGLIHHVGPGDTVRQIAATYSVDVRKIVEVNGLLPPFTIRPGQQLIVPGGVKPRPAPPSPPAQPKVLPKPTVPDSVQAPQSENPLAAAAVEVRPVATPMPAPRNREEAFIFSIAPGAQVSQQATGVPASVTIAQAILESYWGTSLLAREANNYFGIKAREKPGSAGVYWMNAWEVEGGRNVTRREPFRAYASIADSLVDHGRFFHENPRYHRALAVRDDPRQFVREIARAGYATDPAYAGKLISLMDRFNLYRFDQ